MGGAAGRRKNVRRKKRKKKKKKTRADFQHAAQTGGNLDTSLESLSRGSRRLSPVLDEN